MTRSPSNVLVTGGAGFIGSNFIRYLFAEERFSGLLVNLDLLTYAGNPRNLEDIERQHGPERYIFTRADICQQDVVEALLRTHAVDCIVHLAAESHVDRSISGPQQFIQTNVNGTFALLEAARAVWGDRDDVLFHHVSTDEVYGSLGAEGQFHETTPYDPRSPYSASKAASDHLVRSYGATYGLPVTVSNCSNNYGPFQFPEKLLPLLICRMLDGGTLPIYGDGQNVRDWLYVEDHAAALWAIICGAATGETYNVGGDNEWANLDLVRLLCRKVAEQTGNSPSDYEQQITFVRDRPGHDRRYAINCDKLKRDLGWSQTVDIESGLERTVRWYLQHPDWVAQVSSGAYREWIAQHYGAG